jgi:hypothetical protein
VQIEAHDCGIGGPGIQAWAAVVGRDGGSSCTPAINGAAAAEEAAGVAAHPLSAAALPSSSRLRVLHLDGNDLGESGARALRPLLGGLEEAYLGSTSLGDKGAAITHDHSRICEP